MQHDDTKDAAGAIHTARSLDCQPDRLESFYAKWADTYDQDVHSEQYSAPEYMARCMDQQLGDDRNVRILDAGCGTGLVGVALHTRGYRHIDGLDLSHAMISKARQTGAYTSLSGGHDLTQTLLPELEQPYDATVCCGVFTTGHVPPRALEQLVRVTRAGGVVLVSTRTSYCTNTDFKRVYEGLIASGALTLRDRSNGPYLAEEGAFYWAFEVT